MAASKKPTQKAVLITTEHRGVFFGYVPARQDMNARTMALKGARCAIYWGTTKGVAQLAHTGPTTKSRIGAPADLEAIHDIIAVWAVTPEAEQAWVKG